MKTWKYAWTPRAVAMVMLALCCGCAGPSVVYDKPQNRFDFPNSNVIPIGHVSGKSTKYTFLFPSVSDPSMEEDAVRQALAERGGDMLIDGEYYWRSFGYFIYWTEVQVEGQAATVDLGLQHLNKQVPVKK